MREMFSVRGLMDLSFAKGAAILALATGACAFAQSPPMSITDAIRLAAERNGTLRAAIISVKIAREQTAQSRSSLFPTISPFYQYSTSRRDSSTGGGVSTIRTSGHETGLNASWSLLDNGQRDLSIRSASRSEEAARQNASSTIRNVLFNIQQQFYDALRAQSLLRIDEAQVVRSKTILDQTDKRIELRDAAKKDHLQANADYLNAKVTVLAQRNNVTASHAALAATVGLEGLLPELVDLSLPSIVATAGNPTMLVAEALKNRPELRARRSQIEAQSFQVQRSRLGTLPGFSLNGSYDFAFNPAHRENGSLTFFLSMPLFDGGLSRAQLNSAKLQLDQLRAQLAQDERDVRAEVETAAQQFDLNGERLEASIAARDAAIANYQAAEAAHKAGAASVVDVLTAQVSLVTAESNYIEAVYDYLIADTRLKLVTGRAMPGEELIGRLP